MSVFRWWGIQVEWPRVLTNDAPRAGYVGAFTAEPERSNAYDLTPAPAPPTLPDTVPVRPAFREGVTVLRCPVVGCGLVWGDDIMRNCWTHHIPGEPMETP